MDSAALLDLLGNENRRRILRLLARKPCYVTEISEYLGVSPKAVIDHLRKLEEAGLVESRIDEQRRKYFHIARNVRLEVNVSPYQFGTKSAYPASPNLDMTSCRFLSIDLQYGDGRKLDDLADELRKLEQLENELSLAQRWVQGRICDIHDRIGEAVDDPDNSRLYAEVLSTVADGASDADEIADRIDVPPSIVEDTLMMLEESGLVRRTTDGWNVSEL